MDGNNRLVYCRFEVMLQTKNGRDEALECFIQGNFVPPHSAECPAC